MGAEDEIGEKNVRRYYCQICGLSRSKRPLLKQHLLSQHGMAWRFGRNVTDLIRRQRSDCILFVNNAAHLLENLLILNNTSYLTQPRNMPTRPRLVQGRSLPWKSWVCVAHLCDGMGSQRNSTVQRWCLYGSVPGWVTTCEAPSGCFYLPRSRITIDSHHSQRSFTCPIDGCHSSYKRQDHLNRHLLKHEGMLFTCPWEDCNSHFTTSSNFKRHVRKHQEKGYSSGGRGSKLKEEKKFCCTEPGCLKAFRYSSKLKKHMDDVHCNMEYAEVVCCEPGCGKYFTNAEALKEHVRLSHIYISCEICGSQQLKKQIKRHMRTHDSQPSTNRIRCHFERCMHSYTRKSNLDQHIKAVHLDLKPYKCRFDGCEMACAYRNVRDNHEMSGAHCYVQGDFVEEDAIFQSRPRGGRKRKAFTFDSLLRKRVALPNEGPTVLESSCTLLNWLTSNNIE